MIDDATLLQAYARSRNAEAFAELSRRYAGLIYGTCLRILGNPADAEDTAQECFLELARKAGEIRTSLPGWLHAVARSRSLDALRKNATRRRNEQQATPPGERDALSWGEIERYVDEALAALPDDLRMPLVLHYLQGMTQADIAARYGISQAAVSQRLKRGVGELREQLRKLGVVVSVALLAALLGQHAAVAAPAALMAGLGKMAISGAGSTAMPLSGTGKLAAFSSKLVMAAGKAAAGLAVIGTLAIAGSGLINLPLPHWAEDLHRRIIGDSPQRILYLVKQADRACSQGEVSYEKIQIPDTFGLIVARGVTLPSRLTSSVRMYYDGDQCTRTIIDKMNTFPGYMEMWRVGSMRFTVTHTLEGLTGQPTLGTGKQVDIDAPDINTQRMYQQQWLFDMAPRPSLPMGRGLSALEHKVVTIDRDGVKLTGDRFDGREIIEATLDPDHGYVAKEINRWSLTNGEKRLGARWVLNAPKRFDNSPYIATEANYYLFPKQSLLVCSYTIRKASFQNPDPKLFHFDWHQPHLQIVDGIRRGIDTGRHDYAADAEPYYKLEQAHRLRRDLEISLFPSLVGFSLLVAALLAIRRRRR